MRKFLMVALLGAALGAVPAAQAEHCPPNSGIFVGSNGTERVVAFFGPGTPGADPRTNPGNVGCTIDDDNDHLEDTYYIIPGAASVTVRSLVDSATAPTGTLTADDPAAFALCSNPCTLGGWVAGTDGADAGTDPDFWTSGVVGLTRAWTVAANSTLTATLGTGDTATYRSVS